MRNSYRKAKRRPGTLEVDLAIELQEPPYLYSLSPAELEVLREYIQENLLSDCRRVLAVHSCYIFSPKDDGKLASALITEESTPRLLRIGDLVKST
jgi:hypothetical protein